MKILFLDQSGNLGGAELCLLDIVKPFANSALVGLLSDGPFRQRLEAEQIPVQVLTQTAIRVRKESSLIQSLSSMSQILPLVRQTARLAEGHDIIYANTPKALIVGALASLLSRRPLVYHLHDIISPEHFSAINRHIMIALANRAVLVIANSQASREAFIAAGGRVELVHVVYNGFAPEQYQVQKSQTEQIRQKLGLKDKFVVGSFSRLSPWKGQHVLIEALSHCPEDVVAILVGDALFGEQNYVNELHRLVEAHNLRDRIHFLGFRNDIPALMHTCDVVAHTSTAPEPFGRVIVEAMLCGRPAIAAAAGGAIELIEHGKTGWLCPPNNPQKLAELILDCYGNQELGSACANHTRETAQAQFDLTNTNQQIEALLSQL